MTKNGPWWCQPKEECRPLQAESAPHHLIVKGQQFNQLVFRYKSIFLPEILITSSSSLPLWWCPTARAGWVLGKGTGPDANGLKNSVLSASSKLPSSSTSSSSEPLSCADGLFLVALGRHFLSIALGTRSRVTIIVPHINRFFFVLNSEAHLGIKPCHGHLPYSLKAGRQWLCQNLLGEIGRQNKQQGSCDKVASCK